MANPKREVNGYIGLNIATIRLLTCPLIGRPLPSLHKMEVDSLEDLLREREAIMDDLHIHFFRA